MRRMVESAGNPRIVDADSYNRADRSFFGTCTYAHAHHRPLHSPANGLAVRARPGRLHVPAHRPGTDAVRRRLHLQRRVPLWVVGRLVVTLLPFSLALTIPMSVLLALLVAFGRLSADREFVALQACGVSLYRLFRPVALVAVDQLPRDGLRLHGPDSGRESGLPGDHVQHPGVQRRKRGQTAGSSSTGFRTSSSTPGNCRRPVAGTASSSPTTASGEGSSVYLARHGRAVVNRDAKTVEMVLEEWTRHEVDPAASTGSSAAPTSC